jgi:hypothetical protein
MSISLVCSTGPVDIVLLSISLTITWRESIGVHGLGEHGISLHHVYIIVFAGGATWFVEVNRFNMSAANGCRVYDWSLLSNHLY